MKKVLFAALAMVAMMACETKVSDSADSNNDSKAMADKNAEGTKKVYRAIETGDVSALDSLFTDDVIDHDGPQGQPVKGRDSVKAMLGQIHTFIDNLHMELLQHATSSDGKYHYATVRMTGKAKANPWGMPPGMEIDDTSVDMIMMRDGKCAEHWGFMSMKDFNEVMMGMMGDSAKDSNK
jgi:ketosteroid isomerase-like protein